MQDVCRVKLLREAAFVQVRGLPVQGVQGVQGKDQ
jgi:hypothetical protein